MRFGLQKEQKLSQKVFLFRLCSNIKRENEKRRDVKQQIQQKTTTKILLAAAAKQALATSELTIKSTIMRRCC